MMTIDPKMAEITTVVTTCRTVTCRVPWVTPTISLTISGHGNPVTAFLAIMFFLLLLQHRKFSRDTFRPRGEEQGCPVGHEAYPSSHAPSDIPRGRNSAAQAWCLEQYVVGIQAFPRLHTC